MLKIVVLGTVLSFAMGHPIREDVYNEIKKRTTQWTPKEISENPLANYTEEQIRGLLGTFTDEIPNNLQFGTCHKQDGLPDNFDARNKWGAQVHPIRDQGACGSCWAFGATEALSDRFAINGVNVILSPQDLVSCDKSNYGCSGGIIQNAWTYLEKTGAVADSDYEYTSGTSKQTGTCDKTKDSKKKYKCKAGTVVQCVDPDGIKAEIYKNGPMETRFNVYEDFMHYSGGIYHHVYGQREGGHAIKILGWGKEGDIHYWLCANSWGPKWGIDGFFKIEQGECGIDATVLGCTPDTKSLEESFLI